MPKLAKIGIVVALAAVVAWAILGKQRERAERPETASSTRAAPAPAERPRPLPRLVEVGGGTCEPCRRMKPVLEALRRKYAGQLQVDIIDTDKDPDAEDRYRILLIPTQIFFDPDGKELDRCDEGFLSETDIVAKWKKLGYELAPPRPRTAPPTTAEGEAPEPGGDAKLPLLTRLFEALTRLVRGAPAVALGASFLWGILSVLLSPCHLSSIPLIVGFIDAQGRTTARRAFATSSLFAAGILITIGIIGGITAAAGKMLGSVGAWANYFVAAIFLLVALVLLDVLPMPWSGPGQVGMKRRGPLAAFILGLVFGIALGPCTFAYMAPMLGVTFKVASASLAYGVLLLVAYGIGHCAVIVAAGTSTELVQRYLNWNERSKGAVAVKRLCGVLVALGGVYLIHIAR